MTAPIDFASTKAKLAPLILRREENKRAWLMPLLDQKIARLFPFFLPEKTAGTFPHDYHFTPASHETNRFHLEQEADGKPRYLVNIPFHPDLSTKKPDFTRFRALIQLLTEESFFTKKTDSLPEAKKRIAAVINVNACHSLSPEKNNRFFAYFDSIPKVEGIFFQVIGGQWDPPWNKRVAIRCSYTPWGAMRIVRAQDAELATELEKNLESAISKCVPYQDLRQAGITSRKMDEIFREFRQKAPNAPVYLQTMDSDVIALRNKNSVGLFSHYDSLVEGSDAYPSLMTTGYRFSEEEKILYRIGADMDMAVRAAMAEEIPLAPYFAEPNFQLLIKPGTSPASYSYVGGPKKTKKLESRRLIENARRQGRLAEEGVIFSTTGAIPIAVPERFRTEVGEKFQQISVDKLGELQVIKFLSGMKQSHVSLKKWGDNLYTALPIRCDVYRASTAMREIYKAYHPIYLAQAFPGVEKYSFRYFKKLMRNYLDLVNDISGSDPGAFTRRGGNAEFVQVFQEKINAAKTELRALPLDEEWIEKVELTAISSGHAIFQTFRSWGVEA